MKINYLTFSILLISSISVCSQNSWELIRSESGINIYFKSYENSDFIELKTTTIFDTDIETFLCILSDIENFPNWSYGTIKSELIQSTEKEFIYYIVSDMPWPICDRESVIKLKIFSITDETISTLAVCVKGFREENPEYIRIYDLTGIWTLKKINDSQIEATYNIKLNPGAGIPDWIIKFGADTAPFKSFMNLKKEILKEEYVNCYFDTN